MIKRKKNGTREIERERQSKKKKKMARALCSSETSIDDYIPFMKSESDKRGML